MECSAQSIRISASSEQWGLTGSFGLWGGGGGERGCWSNDDQKVPWLILDFQN